MKECFYYFRLVNQELNIDDYMQVSINDIGFVSDLLNSSIYSNECTKISSGEIPSKHLVRLSKVHHKGYVAILHHNLISYYKVIVTSNLPRCA